MFDREYELSTLVSFVNEKIESELITLDTYISTDNMLMDRGGVEPATKLPTATRFNHFKDGDTLFSNIRTYFRKVWLAEFEGGASADVLIFRTKDSEVLDPNYLYFLLSNEDFVKYTVLTAKGAKMPRDDKAAIMQYKFFLPEIDKQREVGLILLGINKKIDLNRQTNQTLEQIAQAIFKSWFVDFEPTRAKIIAKEQGANSATQELAAQAIICGAITLEQLEELEQNLETTLQQAIDKKLNQHNQTNPTALNAQQLKTTAALFPNELVESELGDVPEGWDCQALSGWGDIVCGKTPSKKKDEYYGGNIPFIKIPDMHGNMYAIETVDSLTKEGAETQKKKRLPKGSVCVSCIATVGQVVIACEDSFTNQQINSIVPLENSYTPYLYFAMLEQYDYLHDLASGGSATLNLNTGNFSKIQIVKPSPELLNTFSQVVQPIMDNILTNSYQQQVLASIRDSLLPKLLSGELKINKEVN